MAAGRHVAIVRRMLRRRMAVVLALVALTPLILLALLEKAMTGHMRLSFGTSLTLALLVAIMVAIFIDRQVLRPMIRLAELLAETEGARAADGAAVSPAAADSSSRLRVAEPVHRATAQLVRDQAALAVARDTQLELTREIHHRVKNNLQVIVSLLSLHRRAASDPAAEQAYLTIQSRVEALTAVHRNLVATGEGGGGIQAGQLLDDLAGICGEAARGHAPTQFAVDADHRLILAEDAALPAAFLIAELAALAQQYAPGAGVALALSRDVANPDLAPAPGPAQARLTVRAAIFADPACDQAVTSGYVSRILAGLSRQLQSPLDRSADRTSFAVRINLAGDSAP